MRRIMACTRATVSTTWRADPSGGADVLRLQQLVVVGVGVGDAALPGGTSSSPSW